MSHVLNIWHVVFLGVIAIVLCRQAEPEHWGAKLPIGALVMFIPTGSKADRGGLRPQDVVKSVDVAGSEFLGDGAPMLLMLQAATSGRGTSTSTYCVITE
jgi:hypothetical protein